MDSQNKTRQAYSLLQQASSWLAGWQLLWKGIGASLLTG